ncbi:sulfatase [Verrucomicrobia bacterium]|nr:sulfatase [Verrucomicrobiota bacterium]
MKRIYGLMVAAILSMWLQPTLTTAAPPNFIIIFCDDLGYNDIGPFGSTKHRTPNLDRMAAEGIKFTDFYVTSGVCSPSRASLMTGCYPIRVGLDQNEKGGWVLFPGNKRGLNPGEITIPEILKKKGYATACIGKWHLGDQPAFLPTNQGFDSYFGIPYSNDMGAMNGAGKVVSNRNYPPLPLLRDNEIIETEPDQRLITQRYTKEVLKYIRENKTNPFFLYFPQTMPHAPQFASKNFEGKSKNGKWGDAVEEIDWSVGQVLNELKEQGIEKITFVIFLSDNGGAMNWGASNAPLSGGKGSTMEGGQRVPFLGWWPGKIPAGSVTHELATSMDLLPSLAHLAGAQAPTDRYIDGRDIRNLLLAKPGARSPHDSFYYYYRNHLQAVRSGPWKLHFERTQKGRGKNAKTQTIPLRLFHLNKDIGEKNNVAENNPRVVKRLQAIAEEAREDLGDIGRPGINNRAPGHVENAIQLRR